MRWAGCFQGCIISIVASGSSGPRCKPSTGRRATRPTQRSGYRASTCALRSRGRCCKSDTSSPALSRPCTATTAAAAALCRLPTAVHSWPPACLAQEEEEDVSDEGSEEGSEEEEDVGRHRKKTEKAKPAKAAKPAKKKKRSGFIDDAAEEVRSSRCCGCSDVVST